MIRHIFTLYICSSCLRLDVSSLTEIQHLHIETSEKETYTNERKMLKMLYLYGFVRWIKCIWWIIENNYLFFSKLFDFAVEWIPVIRNKAEIVFSSKNPLHYCNCLLSNFSLLFKLNSFFGLVLFSSGIHNGREKKLVNNYV